VGDSDRAFRESRAAFEAETAAYAIAGTVEALAKHIPAGVAACRIRQVLDDFGKDISSHYLLDCCYGMERLVGMERPAFGVPRRRFAEMLALLGAFEDAGVGYPTDATVFGWRTGRTLKVIDIATHDVKAAFRTGF
jgi:hypothetical protein